MFQQRPKSRKRTAPFGSTPLSRERLAPIYLSLRQSSNRVACLHTIFEKISVVDGGSVQPEVVGGYHIAEHVTFCSHCGEHDIIADRKAGNRVDDGVFCRAIFDGCLELEVFGEDIAGGIGRNAGAGTEVNEDGFQEYIGIHIHQDIEVVCVVEDLDGAHHGAAAHELSKSRGAALLVRTEVSDAAAKCGRNGVGCSRFDQLFLASGKGESEQ